MFGFLRAAGYAAATMVLTAAFAAPSMAAEAKVGQLAVQTASVASLPEFSVTLPAPALTAPQLPASASSSATVAPTIQVSPVTIAAPAAPAQARPLRDLVISFVDYGNQDAEQDCLAKAVYFEARGETLEGQLAVAQVIMNRAKSGLYPTTICQVVTQPAQFSFIRNGQFPEIDRSSACWHKAMAIADIARKHLADEIAPNVLWYHANYVAPSWGRRLTRVVQIGMHIFYS